MTAVGINEQDLVEAHDTAVRYRLEQLFEVEFQVSISLAEYL